MNDQHGDRPDDGPHDLAAPYALDALTDREREQFEAHLSGCGTCRAEVADLREAAVALSDGMEVAPSADLRRRVLEQVAAEPRRGPQTLGSRPLGRRAAPRRDTGSGHDLTGPSSAAAARSHRGWWVAAAAVVAIGAGTWVTSQVLEGQDPATRIVQASDAQEFDAAEGDLTVIASAEQDAAVLRLPDDLGPPPQGRVYQAWYVGADGSARSAGLLTEEVLKDGEAVLDGELRGAAAVGVTVEPEGGSSQPTSEPFAVVPLG